MRHERAHGQHVVDNTAAEAHDSGALAGDIPGNTHARREVLPVAFVDRTDVLAYLFKAISAGTWLPIAKLIVCFGWHALEFVAQTQIERNFLGDTPVVLRVAGIKPL